MYRLCYTTELSHQENLQRKDSKRTKKHIQFGKTLELDYLTISSLAYSLTNN